MDRLPELLGHLRRTHSNVQIRHQIVTKGGAFCDYGALRCCLRDLDGKRKVVRDLVFRLREIQLELEEKRLPVDGHIAKGRAAIAMDRLNAEFDDLQGLLNERCYELANFYAVAVALKDRIEEEEGPLTLDRHEHLEMDMWEHRYMLDAADDLRQSPLVHPSTMRSIRSLPREVRSRILSKIMRPDVLINWADQLDYQLPDVPLIKSREEVIRHVADADRCRLRAS